MLCWIITILVCMSRVGWNPSWFPDYRDYGSLSTGIGRFGDCFCAYVLMIWSVLLQLAWSNGSHKSYVGLHNLISSLQNASTPITQAKYHRWVFRLILLLTLSNISQPLGPPSWTKSRWHLLIEQNYIKLQYISASTKSKSKTNIKII